MSDTVFTTERLTIRRWRDSDLPDLLAVYGDAEAMQWVGDGKPITREECVGWLEITRANYARRGYGMFAVERLSQPGLIGCCGIVHPGGQPEPEVKYAYLRSHWGQGFATEALIGLIDFGATQFGLRNVIATTAPANAASHRVLSKAGMQRGEILDNGDGSQTLVFNWFAAP